MRIPVRVTVSIDGKPIDEHTLTVNTSCHTDREAFIREVSGLPVTGGWQTETEPQTDDEWRKVTVLWGRNTYEGLVCGVEQGTDRMTDRVTVQIKKILHMAEANHV